MTLSTPRVLAQAELPVTPPRRSRRPSILVRTIGGVAAGTDDGASETIGDVGAIRIIGGANGRRDELPDVGIIHVIGGANGSGDEATNVGIVRVIGGANGRGDDPAGGR